MRVEHHSDVEGTAPPLLSDSARAEDYALAARIRDGKLAWLRVAATEAEAAAAL